MTVYNPISYPVATVVAVISMLFEISFPVVSKSVLRKISEIRTMLVTGSYIDPDPSWDI